MKKHKFNLTVCANDLIDYKNLLSQPEIKETALLNFFAKKPNLLSLMGEWINTGSEIQYQKEFSLFNEFRADFAICDAKGKKYLFIEFEEGTSQSIFKAKPNSTFIRHEWSSKFEHGYSQVIDWYYRMSDYERTNKLKELFGKTQIEYSGLLIIGRTSYLSNNGLEDRFIWRKKKCQIDSKPLHCMTFDDLFDELQEKWDGLNAIATGQLN